MLTVARGKATEAWIPWQMKGDARDAGGWSFMAIADFNGHEEKVRVDLTENFTEEDIFPQLDGNSDRFRECIYLYERNVLRGDVIRVTL